MLEALAAVLTGDQYVLPPRSNFPRNRETPRFEKDPSPQPLKTPPHQQQELSGQRESKEDLWRFGELAHSTAPGKNHNNNNHASQGQYFNKLEQENFFLRTQLQSLLQEIRAKEELEQEQEDFSLPGTISHGGNPGSLPHSSSTSISSIPTWRHSEERHKQQRPGYRETHEDRASFLPSGTQGRSSSLESSVRRQPLSIALSRHYEQSDLANLSGLGSGPKEDELRHLVGSPIRRRSPGESTGCRTDIRSDQDYRSVSRGQSGDYLGRSSYHKRTFGFESGEEGEEPCSAPIRGRQAIQDRLQTLEKELADTAAHQRSLELERQRAITDMLATSSESGQETSIYNSSVANRRSQEAQVSSASGTGESSSRNHQNLRKVSSLECKVEALERKYELQAVKHRQLTDELVRLRRQSSTGDLEPLGSVSIEVQTSPEEEGVGQWPLPSADAVHGSPQRSPAFRRPASDSPKPGAHHYPLAQNSVNQTYSSGGGYVSSVAGGYLESPPVPASSSLRLLRQQRGSLPSNSLSIEHYAAAATARRQTIASQSQTTNQQLLRQGCSVQNFGPKGQLSRADLIDWVSDHPRGRLFRAKFGYLPIRDSPNERPELELTLEPGEYVLIQGDLDEDLFYVGRKISGESGLVPSNYVERVADHELYTSGKPSTSRSPPQPLQMSGRTCTEGVSRVGFRASPQPLHKSRDEVSRLGLDQSSRMILGPSFQLPPAPSGLDGARLGNINPVSSSGKFQSLVGKSPRYVLSSSNNGGENNSGDSPSTPLPESVCPYPAVDVSRVSVHEVRQMEGARVPFPRDLLVERQLAKSVVISWSAPDSQQDPVTQYHVCVDGTVKAVVPGGYKTKALVEDLDHCFPHRISVRAVTENGHSPDASCTVTVGTDVSVAPGDTKVNNVTPVSAQVAWYPSNSNCEHLVLLNGLKVGACPPGVHSVLLKGLIPSTMYRCAVRAKYPRAVLEERPVESFVDFKTLPKIGLPDPPGNVQCEPGPQDWTLLITWEAVTNQPKPPSRAAVSGYLIYADGKKVLETHSPSGDHALLKMSDFLDDPPLFITVRTKTKEGSVSSDSNVIRVPRTMHGAAAVLTPKKRIQPSPNAQAVMQSVAEMLEPTPAVTTVTTSMASQMPPGVLTSGTGQLGSQGGLLMIQPSPEMPQQTAVAQQSPFHTANMGALTQVSQPGGLAGGNMAQLVQQPIGASLPGMQQPPYAMYTLPPGAQRMTAGGLTYTQPQAQGQVATTLVPAGQSGQYYVFHPQLARAQQGIVQGEKPSLMEMENNYLVKHNLLPYNQAIGSAAGPYSTLPTAGALPAQGGMPYSMGGPYQQEIFNSQGLPGSVRTLPAINPATGLPFRSDQYAQAWQTLSPATRRRLEQYINQPFPPTNAALQEFDRRRENLNKKRAAWRKRSFSADEELEMRYQQQMMTLDPYGYPTGGVPRIQITGASGSEGGPGSIIDFTGEDWDYSYPVASKPSARFRKRYYQQGNSRAHSEPDLRLDDRLMALNRSRYVMALFDYEPRHMSPNPNAAQEELSFRKGQVIKIFGSRDSDGFYRGELNGRRGLVPSNMVASIDKEAAYRMQELSLTGLPPGPVSGIIPPDMPPYPQRMPPAEYPYYPSRPPTGPALGMRRRSDNWPQNSSDPALNLRYGAAAAATGGGNYSDYDSSTSAERYPAGRAEDPRLRRMRFGSTKSRSLDAYRKDEYGRPIPRRGRPPMEPDASEYDRARYPAPLSDRGDREMYRGSLDRRAERARDYSLPARSPSQQDLIDRQRRERGMDPRYERPAFDLGQPDFDRKGERDYYSRREGRGRSYPDEYDPRRGGLPGQPSLPAAPPGDRYYDDRRRLELERGRSEGYRYTDEPRKMEEDRYRSERELELRRRGEYPPSSDPGRYYPERGRGLPEDLDGRYPGGPPPQGAPGAYPGGPGAAHPERDQFDQFYEQGGAPTRRKGRSGVRDEQSVRQAPQKMMARFDYDPKESSPNVDAENMELTFRAGDIIMVYGEIDDDGFYIGDLNGKRGLVPSNFLEPFNAAALQLQQEEAAAIRSRKDGVTFSDSIMEDLPRTQPPAQSSIGAIVGTLPSRATGPAAKPAGQKSGGAKPPGVMKQSSQTAMKTGLKKMDPGAKSSPAQSRKASQAAGPKNPAGTKRK